MAGTYSLSGKLALTVPPALRGQPTLIIQRLRQAWRVTCPGWLAVPVLLTRTARLGSGEIGTGSLGTARLGTGGIGTRGAGRLGRGDRLA